MGEMDEEVDESQGQASERSPLREIPEEELQKILEAHRKWVESEGKEGNKAGLARANLRQAYLFEANLAGASLAEANLQNAFLLDADLEGANLAEANLEGADLLNAQLDDFLKQLGLPPNHNERVKKRLAEEKKATGAKP
jgi:hypothetical protein